MSICDTIGRIVEAELDSFLWQIPDFSGLPKEKGIFFTSPVTPLAEWFFYIYPNGTEDYPGRILLELRRWANGPAKTFRCTVGVRREDGEEEQVGTQIVKLSGRYTPWVLFPFCTRVERGKFLSSDTLTLTLRITEERVTASQGDFIRCHNQACIANKDNLSELKEECVALLRRSLSKTTVCDVILLSAKLGESELMEAATNFFAQNIKEILVTVEWQTFLSNHPTEGNELYIKSLNILL